MEVKNDLKNLIKDLNTLQKTHCEIPACDTIPISASTCFGAFGSWYFLYLGEKL